VVAGDGYKWPKRCVIKDGYAKATADYDERGNQVAWACFGPHDKPAINKADGTHSVKKSYDSRVRDRGGSAGIHSSPAGAPAEKPVCLSQMTPGVPDGENRIKLPKSA